MKKYLFVLFGVFGLLNSTFAETVIKKETINYFDELNQYVVQFNTQPPDNTCVIYDMDNTIVTNDPYFGGDHWATWNNSLDKSDENKLTNWGVSDDFHSLEGAIRMFIAYRLTEESVPSIIDNIKDTQKHPSIVMTARSFERYYSATENELNKNNLNFATNPIGITGSSDTTLTLTPNHQRNAFKAYYNGVYYTAEENKGVEIQLLIAQQRLLTRNNSLCKNIIFIDNSKKNVDNVYNEFVQNNKINANVISINYTYDRYFSSLDSKSTNSWIVNKNGSAANNLRRFVESLND